MSKAVLPKSKKPPQKSQRGLGIVHRPTGEFWTLRMFDSEIDAKSFFDDFWRSPGFKPESKPKWSGYRVVRVRQTLHYTGEVDA